MKYDAVVEPEFHPGTLVNVLPSAFAFVPYPYYSPSSGWCTALVLSCVDNGETIASKRMVEVLLLIDTVLMHARINPSYEVGTTWKTV